jgi:hypothetical protein
MSLQTRSPYPAAVIEPVIRRLEAEEARTMYVRYQAAEANEAQAGTRLLLELSSDELEGRVRLTPELARRWREAFPDRPLLGGRVSTQAQRDEIEELEAAMALDERYPVTEVSEGGADAAGVSRFARAAAAASDEVRAFFGLPSEPYQGEGQSRVPGDAGHMKTTEETVRHFRRLFDAGTEIRGRGRRFDVLADDADGSLEIHEQMRADGWTNGEV